VVVAAGGDRMSADRPPPPHAVDAAIGRVLAVEETARAGVADAQREAAAEVERARRDARAILERTERRVRLARERHEAAVAARIAAIEALAETQSVQHVVTGAETALTARAAAELAAELAGGA
jgi:F0F1-type ATP synthase membrane subunit b/b'